ncbi:unnamed protein product [Spirodela intermedia]|uniref:Uncharacterized protein n=1 Tax=Spirodela intermedia TaxID=51605 RepID=A0A7I8LGJ2_SPIIN|nr:unnamed protein product [Spirodela intermedia]
MAAFQRFKLLATQCATAAGSPSRSPLPTSSAKSPSFHLRRRKTTLRRLLSRSSSSSSSTRRLLRRREEAGDGGAQPGDGERKGLLSHHTSLKDLFVSSSPSPPDPGALRLGAGDCGRQSPPPARSAVRRSVLEGIGGGGGRFRSTAALRFRLLRRAWRPALLTIPE